MIWPCDAYGEEGIEVGAMCFVTGAYDRTCMTQLECRVTMQQCRRLLFQRILDLAAEGDETAIYLRDYFHSPDELLNAATGDSALDIDPDL